MTICQICNKNVSVTFCCQNEDCGILVCINCAKKRNTGAVHCGYCFFIKSIKKDLNFNLP